MSTNWICHNCGDKYEEGEKLYQCEGGICFCNHCWELLLKEKLPAKEVKKRIK